MKGIAWLVVLVALCGCGGIEREREGRAVISSDFSEKEAQRIADGILRSVRAKSP